MARQGRAGPALAAAALGSFFAGSVATLVLVLFAPPLTAVALEFGPAEYFSLVVLGLISSVALAHGSVLKALAMIVLGLLLGLVGTDIYTGEQRFTLGRLELADGINFVAVAVGVFGIAEILRNLEDEHDRDVAIRRVSGLMPSREDLRRIAAPVLRGTVLGSLLGILPGGGHVLAAFAAYTLEKKVSSRPERFGQGAIEGVAAPEFANNAAAQTSFIPMLTLGIPANPVMALMIGAMIIQGITPGPAVAADEPALFWGLIVSMWLGNLLLVVLNLPLIRLWVWMLKIPYYVLFPAILTFSAIGVYSINNNAFDLFTVAAVRPARLFPRAVRVRAGAAAAGLRARADARGAPAARDDHRPRRSAGFPAAADQRRPAGARGSRLGDRADAERREEARGSIPRG